MYKIYKLVYNNEVVYIGQTTRSLEKRKSSGYPNNEELNKIYKECDIILIEETNSKSSEGYWIFHYKNNNCNLLNINNGIRGMTYDIEYKELDKKLKSNKRSENRKNENNYQKEYRELNKDILDKKRKIYLDSTKDERNKKRREKYKQKKEN